MKNKYLILSLAVALIFTLCGCNNNPKEMTYGDISEVVSADNAPLINGKPVKGQFKPTSTALKYDFTTANIGRAYMQMPYPKTWELTMASPYHIVFKAPANDPYLPGVYIHFRSTLQEGSIIADGSNYEDEDNIRLHFNGKLQDDTFPTPEGNLYISSLSKPEKIVINTSISKPEDNYHIMYKDKDADVYINGKNSPKERYYHETVAFRWYKIPCVMAGLCSEDDPETVAALDDIMQYMMSNSKYIEENLINCQRDTIFESSMSFKRSPLYEPRDAEPNDMFDQQVSYVCMNDNLTAFSESAINIYEVETDNFQEVNKTSLEFEYLDIFLKDAMGIDYSTLECQSIYNEEISGSSRSWNGQKCKEMCYDITTISSKNGEYAGQKWKVITWTIETNKYTDVVVLVTPDGSFSSTIQSINVLFDTLKYKE